MGSAIWIVISALVLLGVAVAAWKSMSRGVIHTRDYIAWDVAACTSVFVLASISAKVIGKRPDLTVIDVAALIGAALIAGAFLGASLFSRKHRGTH